MSVLGRVLAGSIGLASTAALVAGSQLPWRPETSGEASIRLSWRTVSEPVSECRIPTAEELESLPLHMRMQKICERRHAPFRLLVRIDDQIARDVLLSPAGARGDRPLYVFEELRVSPGAHRVAVRFVEERAESPPAERPAVALTLEAELSLEARDIALVTLDGSGEHLAVTLPDR